MHHAISVRDGPSGRRGFAVWEMPASLIIHQFVRRVGEFGGYAVLKTAESRAIEWRDGLRRSQP